MDESIEKSGVFFNGLNSRKLHQERIGVLKDDPEFEDAITHSTSHTKIVNKRIEKSTSISTVINESSDMRCAKITSLHDEYSELIEFCKSNNQVSFEMYINDTYKKSLLLSVASFFEATITRPYMIMSIRNLVKHRRL